MCGKKAGGDDIGVIEIDPTRRSRSRGSTSIQGSTRMVAMWRAMKSPSETAGRTPAAIRNLVRLQPVGHAVKTHERGQHDTRGRDSLFWGEHRPNLLSSLRPHKLENRVEYLIIGKAGGDS